MTNKIAVDNRFCETHLKAFTLVELMVAVSIFSIGIVLVLRSFLSAASALNGSTTRIAAVQMLESKMNELELLAAGNESIEQGITGSETTIQNRPAYLRSEILLLNDPDLDNILGVNLSLSWHENNVPKEEKLSAYFPAPKE